MSMLTTSDAPARSPGSPPSPWSPSGEIPYRSISRAAVASLLLGVMSIVAFFDWSLAVVPACAIATAVAALSAIRARPQEITGERLAFVGLMFGALSWSGGWSALGYQYLTEAPSDCLRLSFADLQPTDEAPKSIPPSVRALEGERVFIKGFMYPGRTTEGIREFILCYTQDECCFGGSPKLTHMVRVVLRPPLTARFTTGVCRVAGTFRLGASAPADGVPAAIYHLEADYFQ